MNPALETTSVPAWAIHAVRPDADLSGRYWTVVAFGERAESIAAHWTAQIAARHPQAEVRVHAFVNDIANDNADDAAAAAAVTTDLTDAVVGWRLMIAGPADGCLRLRAFALQCGVADDEITIASASVDIRTVHCVHCGALTRAEADLGDVVTCVGCDRGLVVHYHVSRRLGAHLGFAADVGPATETSTQ